MLSSAASLMEHTGMVSGRLTQPAPDAATHDAIRAELIQLNKWLVQRDYAAMAQRSEGVRLPADQIEWAANNYGRTIIMPPDEAFADLEVIRVGDEYVEHPTWFVCFDLWTQEEGQSDLTLECTMIFVGKNEVSIEIDGLHVL
jgi:hypothetical protein